MYFPCQFHEVMAEDLLPRIVGYENTSHNKQDSSSKGVSTTKMKAD